MWKAVAPPAQDIDYLSLARLPSRIENLAGVRFTDEPVFCGYVTPREGVTIFLQGDRIAQALNARAKGKGYDSHNYGPIEQALMQWQLRQLTCHEHAGGESRLYVVADNVKRHALNVYEHLSRDGLLPATPEGRHRAYHLVEWVAVARELAKDLVSDAVEDSIADEVVTAYRLGTAPLGIESRERAFRWLAVRKGVADFVARNTAEMEGALPEATASLDLLYSEGALSSPELVILYRTVHRQHSINNDLRTVGDGFLGDLAQAIRGNPAKFLFTHELPANFFDMENAPVYARVAKRLKPSGFPPRASDD